jgi:hypothetical protein
LRRLAESGDARREEAGDRGKIGFQLEKICRDFSISSESVGSESEIVAAIVVKITDIRQRVTLDAVHNPPKILDGYTLNESQRAFVGRIGDALHQVRRDTPLIFHTDGVYIHVPLTI